MTSILSRLSLAAVLIMLTFANSAAQIVEIRTRPIGETLAGEVKRINLLGRGLIDYGFEGQYQISAQAVKINIGEPQGFNTPLYLLTGATTGVGETGSNEATIFEMINPIGGLLNASANGYIMVFDNRKVTTLRITFLGSAKLITGREAGEGSSKISPAAYVDAGVLFQTGAWLADGAYEDGGVFWLQLKYSAAFVSESDLNAYFENGANDSPHGPRIAAGIYIKEKVNIKAEYFKPIGGDNLPTLQNSQFRLSLDYNVSKSLSK